MIRRALQATCVACAALIFPVAVFAQGASKTTTGGNRPVAGYAMLMMILLLLIVIMVFGWFLMRSLQRSRQRLGRHQNKATDATDVWAMHKLPGEDDVDDEIDDGDDDADGDDDDD